MEIDNFAHHSTSQAARQGLAVLINGDGPSSAKMVKFNCCLPGVTIMNRLFLNLARVITSRGSITLLNLVAIVSAVAPPHGGEISESHAFYFYYYNFFFFLP